MATAFPSVQVASMVASMSMEAGVFQFTDSIFDLYKKEKKSVFWSYLGKTSKHYITGEAVLGQGNTEKIHLVRFQGKRNAV